MRFITYLATLLFAVFLSACGGGGGSPGLPSVVKTPITTTAAAAITMAVGSTQSFTITGGTSPYQISSSNVKVAVASIDGRSFTITGLATGAVTGGVTASGTATITISDASQQTAAIAVTVSPDPLDTSAPATFMIAKDTSRSFTVKGGVAPYYVVSVDERIVWASVSGTSLTVLGVAAGSTSVIVRDASGASVSLTVTVGGSSVLGFYTTAPSPLTIVKDTSSSFEVGGGVAGYTVVSSDQRIATVLLSGSTMTISGVAPGTTSIVLRDSAGSTLAVGVTVGGSSPVDMFTNAPASVFIASGVTNTYTVTGGVGPYSATSSDAAVVQSSVSGAVVSIRAVGGGAATVVISDAAGTKLSIAVSAGLSTALFVNAPSAVTITAGSSASYVLGGGSAPYAVATSDAKVATGSVSGTVLTVSAVGGGTANLQVTDVAGNKVSLAVTVGSTGAVVSKDPVLKSAVLKDAAGVATNSISASGFTLLSVALTDPSGNGLANQVISVSGDATQVIFPEGASGLTNSSGVASIKVARASLTASGAGALTITYSYKVGAFNTYPDGSTPPTADKIISTYVGYQLSATNIVLTNLNVGAASLAAYGTRQVSVQVNINGVAATTTTVAVNFTATCGQITPATASTNSSGIATVSYTANETSNPTGCSGKTVEISASTTGADVVTATLTITPAAATSIGFISALPSRIYLVNSGGSTQSVVTFKLLDAQNTALPSQDISLTLKTVNGGIPKASFGTVGNLSPITVTTNADGIVSVPVFSGTVPTSVIVNAALVSNALVQTDSAVLTIASGRPAQARVSLAVGQVSIRGFNFDGGETSITMSLADRQGNPVPDGTAINFVTEGGVMIPPVCTTGSVPGDSQCAVKIRSQNPRPANGLVSILAYASGEEDFVDANFNNVYDCGEAWTDQGTAYRDDTATGGLVNAYVAGEFSVPRSASSSTCATGVAPTPQTGDGVWGAVDVRKQAVIVFATDDFNIANAVWVSAVDPGWSSAPVATQLTVSVADLNGNSVPTGSTITVQAIDNSTKLPSDGGSPALIGICTVTGQSHTTVPNVLTPLSLGVFLRACVAGDQIQVTVNTPGISKSVAFTIP